MLKVGKILNVILISVYVRDYMKVVRYRIEFFGYFDVEINFLGGLGFRRVWFIL